jgi:long-chain fatty acid transport protein
MLKQNAWWSSIAASVSLVLAFFTAPNVYGSGFAVYTQGASALGQANAVIAHVDDPSTIFFNPALMHQLEGTQITVGTTLLFPLQEARSTATGRTFKTDREVFFPSTIYITHKVNEKISAGLGIFSPFGLGTDWGNSWEGRYIATNSKLTTFNFNPVVSYQITPRLAFAAGVDFLLLDTTLKKRLNQSGLVPGLPDGKQKFKGDGHGVGYNFGVVYDLNDEISFGASYRSEIDVDIDGHATFAVNPLLASLFPKTSGDSHITLPRVVHAGVAYKGFHRLTLETGMRWEGWSSFDELRINFDQPVAGTTASITEKDWHDTFSANLGATYQLTDTVALLAGYLYSGNPVPEKTFDPIVPDATTHLFTVGINTTYRNIKMAIAYGYQMLEDRKKNNAVTDPLNPANSANGTYETDIHMLGLSFTYLF